MMRFLTSGQIYERVNVYFSNIVLRSRLILNKSIIATIVVFYLLMNLACRSDSISNVNQELDESRLDSLENRIYLMEQNLKPRLTVLMNQMNLHHSRMWTSGNSEKWELVNYEVEKVRESIKEIDLLYGKNIHGNITIHEGLASLSSSLASLETASREGNKDEFVRSYSLLTTSCNSCHKAAGLDFYEIIKPSTPAYNRELE